MNPLNPLKFICFIVLAMLAASAQAGGGADKSSFAPDSKPVLKSSAKLLTPKVISYEITGDFPHDSKAFTQGLEVWGDGYFLESTGQYGKSEIRKVRIKTGDVVASMPLDASFFGEGIARLGTTMYQLTWQEGVILKWTFDGKHGFKPAGKIPWSGEGWGLTHGQGAFWISDGSSQIYEVRAADMSVKRKIAVTMMGEPQAKVNELEWVNGKIFANIWMTGTIVRINPATGIIDGLMDLTPLIPKNLSLDAVANGIAWDRTRKTLYVTGKLWPKVYQLKLVGDSR